MIVVLGNFLYNTSDVSFIEASILPVSVQLFNPLWLGSYTDIPFLKFDPIIYVCIFYAIYAYFH